MKHATNFPKFEVSSQKDRGEKRKEYAQKARVLEDLKIDT